VLRDFSRDIDAPARYGGEELAVVLAQTDLEGGLRAAERMRSGIEALRIPRVDGHADTISVTASFGVASVLGGTGDKRSLIAAADAALYRAKRSGKNRVEAADDPQATAASPGA
jgi:diguanylate cyclase (GGDEF)-like protein